MIRIRHEIWVLLPVLMLFCVAASASSVLNSEEAALLRGGCAGNCKQFDCGYESHCSSRSMSATCNMLLIGGDCGGYEECNSVPNVWMCVTPDPNGLANCPEKTNGACGQCDTCVCKHAGGPFAYCTSTYQFSRYQVLFRHCP